MKSKDFQNGFILGFVSGGVIDTTEIDALENLIDESGVLEESEDNVTEKVEQLIEKVNELDVFMYISNANQLFYDAKSFPTKAVVNLPNATGVYQAFAYWGTEPIPIVEELTVYAPNITNINQAFAFNSGVKKVILYVPNEIDGMASIFAQTKKLEEVVLNFSTINIINFGLAFSGSTAKKIVGVLDFSSATSVNNMFLGCYNLEEVTFEPNTLSISISLVNSSNLTDESIQSIIDGLATVETAQTLTLNSAITLTDEQKATINEKGWTLAQ